MDIEKVRTSFERFVEEFPQNPSPHKFEDKSLEDVIIAVRIYLETASVVIKDFLNIQFTPDELSVVKIVDNSDQISAITIKEISNNINKLAKTNMVVDRNDRDHARRNLIEENKVYEYRRPFDRINRFINEELDEDLCWADGLIVKFDTTNHANSIEKLRVEISHLHKILKTFGRASNNNESDFNIHNLKTGSLILTVTTAAGLVITLGKAINYVLDVIKKCYEIKKHAIELKKIKSEKIQETAIALEEASKLDINTESEVIADKLIKEIGYESKDKHEVRNAVKMATKYLFELMDNGGEVKLLLSPVFIKDEKNKQLLAEVKANEVAYLESRKEIINLLQETTVHLIGDNINAKK